MAAALGRPFGCPLLPGVLVRHACEFGGLPRFSKVVADLYGGDPRGARPGKARDLLCRLSEDLSVPRLGEERLDEHVREGGRSPVAGIENVTLFLEEPLIWMVD